ncbi:MAG: Trans-2,3-dihydro-3-hydroxyanthranilate isomerase [Promethearchaeota archaeon]|nr:MAG: Trans-2,3-dihydro-3-hydroxyanthranilate isomerase [Candidatus Lokiarchaeota archaeon]
MKDIPFYIVDVFTEIKYQGNQLAVFIAEEKLSEMEMQQIANEMHFSETTFITSLDEYKVRIFTPKTELDFAGHPILGTAYILQQKFIKEKIKTLLLNINLGTIPILFKYKGDSIKQVWMEQRNPTFSGFFDPQVISEVIGLRKEDIDQRFPCQEVSTGSPFIIIPIKNLEAMKRSRLNHKEYYQLVSNTHAKALLLFSSETQEKKNDMHVRVFADYLGVPEDPATGSGNGCLAGYLIEHDYFGKDSIEIRVEQGYEINRCSLLHLKANKNGNKINVSVGGNVQISAKGTLV